MIRMDNIKQGDMKLNLGCGTNPVQGWINVDNAIGARLAKIAGFKHLNRKIEMFRHDWHPDMLIRDLRKTF